MQTYTETYTIAGQFRNWDSKQDMKRDLQMQLREDRMLGFTEQVDMHEHTLHLLKTNQL